MQFVLKAVKVNLFNLNLPQTNKHALMPYMQIASSRIEHRLVNNYANHFSVELYNDVFAYLKFLKISLNSRQQTLRCPSAS